MAAAGDGGGGGGEDAPESCGEYLAAPRDGLGDGEVPMLHKAPREERMRTVLVLLKPGEQIPKSSPAVLPRKPPQSAREALAPKDVGNVAFVIFVMMGCAALLPLMAYIGAIDYFMHAFGPSVGFYMPLAYEWANLISLLPLIKIGPWFPFFGRIHFGMSVVELCLASTMIITLVKPAADVGYGLLLTTIVFSGCVNAVLLGSVCALASLFPGWAMSGVMSGQGAAGTSIVLVRIATKLSFPRSEQGERYSAVLYFGIAVIVVLLAQASACVLQWLPVCRYYVSESKRRKHRRLIEPERITPPDVDAAIPPGGLVEMKQLSGGGGEDVEDGTGWSNRLLSPLLDEDGDDASACKPAAESCGKGEEVLDEDVSLGLSSIPAESTYPPLPLASNSRSTVRRERRKRMWFRDTRTLFKIFPQGINAAATFGVTLALFPGVLTLVQGEDVSQDWFILICVTIYNVADWAGFSVPRVLIAVSPRWLMGWVHLRFLFVLFFVLVINPRVIPTDYVVYIAMGLLGFTNGYFGTLSMMFGPSSKGVRQDEKEVAGFWMSVFLNFGLSTGAAAGILIRYLLTVW